MGRLGDDEIERAIRHHRRALKALRDTSAFEGIRHTTAERLLQRLERDLRHLEQELARRGSDPRPGPSARPPHSPASRGRRNET